MRTNKPTAEDPSVNAVCCKGWADGQVRIGRDVGIAILRKTMTPPYGSPFPWFHSKPWPTWPHPIPGPLPQDLVTGTCYVQGPIYSKHPIRTGYEKIHRPNHLGSDRHFRANMSLQTFLILSIAEFKWWAFYIFFWFWSKKYFERNLFLLPRPLR